MNLSSIIVAIVLVLIVLFDIKYLLSGKASDCASCGKECSSCGPVCKFKDDMKRAQQNLQKQRIS